MAARRHQTTDDLKSIPGIRPSLAVDLRDLGVRRVADLERRNPVAGDRSGRVHFMRLETSGPDPIEAAWSARE